MVEQLTRSPFTLRELRVRQAASEWYRRSNFPQRLEFSSLAGPLLTRPSVRHSKRDSVEYLFSMRLDRMLDWASFRHHNILKHFRQAERFFQPTIPGRCETRELELKIRDDHIPRASARPRNHSGCVPSSQ